MRVRQGTVRDWPFMQNLAREVIPINISPWRQQPLADTMRYRERLLKGFWTWIQQSHSKIFIAEDEQEKPLGYLVLYPSATEELTGLQQGWVMDIAVLKEHRGRGIARLLLKSAEDYCREKGIHYLGLAVSSHNQTALRLYQSLGFIEERKLMVKVLKE